MEYSHFKVIGDIQPFDDKDKPRFDSVMIVATIKLDARWNLGHVEDALGRNSGVTLTAGWCSPRRGQHPRLINICCPYAKSMSERAILDKLQDLERTMKIRDGARERALSRSQRSNRSQQYSNTNPKWARTS